MPISKKSIKNSLSDTPTTQTEQPAQGLLSVEEELLKISALTTQKPTKSVQEFLKSSVFHNQKTETTFDNTIDDTIHLDKVNSDKVGENETQLENNTKHHNKNPITENLDNQNSTAKNSTDKHSNANNTDTQNTSTDNTPNFNDHTPSDTTQLNQKTHQKKTRTKQKQEKHPKKPKKSSPKTKNPPINLAQLDEIKRHIAQDLNQLPSLMGNEVLVNWLPNEKNPSQLSIKIALDNNPDNNLDNNLDNSLDNADNANNVSNADNADNADNSLANNSSENPLAKSPKHALDKPNPLPKSRDNATTMATNANAAQNTAELTKLKNDILADLSNLSILAGEKILVSVNDDDLEHLSVKIILENSDNQNIQTTAIHHNTDNQANNKTDKNSPFFNKIDDANTDLANVNSEHISDKTLAQIKHNILNDLSNSPVFAGENMIVDLVSDKHNPTTLSIRVILENGEPITLSATPIIHTALDNQSENKSENKSENTQKINKPLSPQSALIADNPVARLDNELGELICLVDWLNQHLANLASQKDSKSSDSQLDNSSDDSSDNSSDKHPNTNSDTHTDKKSDDNTNSSSDNANTQPQKPKQETKHAIAQNTTKDTELAHALSANDKSNSLSLDKDNFIQNKLNQDELKESELKESELKENPPNNSNADDLDKKRALILKMQQGLKSDIANQNANNNADTNVSSKTALAYLKQNANKPKGFAKLGGLLGLKQKTDEPTQSNASLSQIADDKKENVLNHQSNTKTGNKTDNNADNLSDNSLDKLSNDKPNARHQTKKDNKPIKELALSENQDDIKEQSSDNKKSDLPSELAKLDPSVFDPDNPLRKSWGINRHLDELDKPLLAKEGGLESQIFKRPKALTERLDKLDKPLLSDEGALESQAYVGKALYRPKVTPRPHYAPWYYHWVVAIARPLYRFKLARQEDVLPHYNRQMHERFVGVYTRPKPKTMEVSPKKVIWCHAVSLGELNTVYPLLRSFLDDGHGVCVTSTTQTGFERASVLFADEIMTGQVVHGFVPVDDLPIVGRFIRSVNPHLAIFVETELWANTLFVLTVNRIPTVLVNARLKEKSYLNYKKFPELAKAMMGNLWQVLAQDDESAERFISLGLPNERVAVVDSLKWSSGLADDTIIAKSQALAEQFLPNNTRPIWIAGSTHDGEEMAVLMAHKQILQTHKNALLILVPRHPERFDEVVKLCKTLFKTARQSDNLPILDSTQVLVVDKMGELSAWYGVATVAFVAGSLVDKGGHNPIEPASLGVPIIMGQYTQSCDKVANALLGVGALVQVGDNHDTVAIAKAVEYWFTNPNKAKDAGEQGKKMVQHKKDAMQKQKAYLLPYLK